MANAFDQFDAPQPMPVSQAAPPAAPATTQPQGNIFDQFDKPATRALPAEQQAPGYQAAAKVAQAVPDSPVQRNIVNDLTFNRAPQIAGAVSYADQAARNFLGGSDGRPTPDQAYEATRDVEKQRGAQYASDHPYANFAENVAGTALNPIVGAAGRFVSGAGSLLGSVARGAAAGAPISAAYGAGAANDDPVAGAITGGVGGLALGALGPVAARGLGAITSRVVSPAVAYARSLINPSAAPGIAARAATQEADNMSGQFSSKFNLTPDKIANLAANNPDYQSGAPITAAELISPSAVKTVQALGMRSGVAADELPTLVQQRQYGTEPLDGESGRFLDNVAETTGIDPRTALADHQAMIANSRDDVNPAYTAIRADATPVQHAGVRALIENDPNVARAVAQVRAVTPRDELGDQLNASQLLQARQQLYDAANPDPITRASPPELIASANRNAATKLTAQMNDAIPGFQDATAEAAQYKAPEAAFKNAKGMLFGSGNGKNPSDVQNLINNLNTPDERTAVQRSFMNDILNQETRGGSTRLMLQSGTRQKLAAVFGDDQGNDIADGLQSAAMSRARLAKSANIMDPNAGSRTAGVAAVQAEQDSPVVEALSKGIEGAFHGGPAGAKIAIGNSLLKTGLARLKTAGESPAYRDYQYRMLSQPASDFVANYQPPASTPSPTMLSPGFTQFGAQMSGPQQQQQVSPPTASTKSISSLGPLSKSANQYLDPSAGVR